MKLAIRPRVAICQLGIIPGGRLRVILGIIEILNKNGVIPDVLTSRLAISPEQITSKYGRSLQANFRVIPRAPRLSQDFATPVFNAILKRYASDYNCIINTSNSLIFLPKRQNVITYMFFPRKRRIMADIVSIHQPEKRIERWSRIWLQRTLLRLIYRLSRPHSNHKIICLSEFTKSALEQEYAISGNIPVIYPPVDITRFQGKHKKRVRAIATVGRFGSIKRQLEQIKLAGQLPDWLFHIVGFASNVDYYQHCEDYVERHSLTNVHLYPDASFAQMLDLLQTTKYFLHTLINEPFGITAVQAIAAGCLPIVHDSGGQRETVPEPALRYQNLEEIPDMLEHLESLEHTTVDALVRKLQHHAMSNFDTSVFQRKMEAVLSPYLTD